MDKNQLNGNQTKGYLLVALSGSLWGTIGFFATLLSGMGLDPLMTAFLRLTMASLLLFIILLIIGKGMSLFRISKRGLLSCALIGVISQAFYNAFYMITIDKTGMATAAVLLYTSPVFTAIMSRIFFGESFSSNKIIAIAVNVVGCVLTVTGGNFGGMNISALGVIFGVLSGFTYALMPVFSRVGADHEHPLTSAFYGLVFGVPALFFIAQPWNGIGAEFTPQMLLVLFGYGLLPSALTYIIYFKGLSMVTETSKVAVLCSLETIVAAIIGYLAFQESFTVAKVIGVALVFGSIVIMNSGKQAGTKDA